MITLNSSVYIVLPIIQILDYTVNYLIQVMYLEVKPYTL